MDQRDHDDVGIPDDADERTERAFRRGCHQAVAMALEYVEENSVDFEQFFGVLCTVISGMRFSRKKFPRFMHTAIERTAKKVKRRR